MFLEFLSKDSGVLDAFSSNPILLGIQSRIQLNTLALPVDVGDKNILAPIRELSHNEFRERRPKDRMYPAELLSNLSFAKYPEIRKKLEKETLVTITTDLLRARFRRGFPG